MEGCCSAKVEHRLRLKPIGLAAVYPERDSDAARCAVAMTGLPLKSIVQPL
jgi:hypothetical protein